MRIYHRSTGTLAAILFLATAGAAKATYIETFQDGTDSGGWRLTFDPNRPLYVQNTGGNPGAFLRGQVASPEPAWFIPVGTASPFLGDYAAQHVVALSIDLQFFESGSNVPHQALTLDLQSSFGTGVASNVVEAYYVGNNTRSQRTGWYTYLYSVPANATDIPDGWVVTRHDGQTATGADWVRLMSDVETIAFQVGEPGYLYAALNIWDLGLDNASIDTAVVDAVPEPATMVPSLLAIGLGLVAKRRARTLI